MRAAFFDRYSVIIHCPAFHKVVLFLTLTCISQDRAVSYTISRFARSCFCSDYFVVHKSVLFPINSACDQAGVFRVAHLGALRLRLQPAILKPGKATPLDAMHLLQNPVCDFCNNTTLNLAFSKALSRYHETSSHAACACDEACVFLKVASSLNLML